MKWLIAPDKKRRGLLWIEGGAESQQSLFGPILWRSVGRDPKIELFRRDENPVCVFKAALLDPVDPDYECIPERSTRLRCRTDQISDDRPACLDHAVPHPAHATGMLDAVVGRGAQVAV